MTEVSENVKFQLFATLERIASQYNNKDVEGLISNFDLGFKGVIQQKMVFEIDKLKDNLILHFERRLKRILRFTDITLQSDGIVVWVLAYCTLYKTNGDELTENTCPVTLILKETGSFWKIIYIHF